MEKKKKKLGQQGTTLVELIVTFALIGIFMTAAAFMLSSTLRMFTRMQSTSRAILVSDNILDKVSGEIAAILPPSSATKQGYYCWLEPKDADGKSHWIAFQNRNRSPISIFAAENDSAGKADVSKIGHGQLFMRYYALGGDASKHVDEIDWHYDSRVYMDYTIEDLWFSRDESADSKNNVIRIDLILRNTKTGFEYSAFRYTESYNFDADSTYICERTDIEPGNKAFPLEAPEFQVDWGGGGETPDPPPDPDRNAVLTVYHKVSTGYGTIYDGTDLAEPEFYTNENLSPYPRWISLHQLRLPGFDFVKTIYQAENGMATEATDQDPTLKLEDATPVEFTFYYKPKETPYCYAAYDENGTRIQAGEQQVGKHGEMVTVTAPEIEGYTLISSAEISRPLVFTYDHQGYIFGGPNEFKFYYNRIVVPYTILYMCNDDIISSETGTLNYNDRLNAYAKWFSGYEVMQSSNQNVSFLVNEDSEYYDSNTHTVTVIFRYRSTTAGNHPFTPAGQDIEIEGVTPDQNKEVYEMMEELAQEISNFFNGTWKYCESENGEYKGYYRTFDYEGETCAVAGWANTEGKEGTLEDTIEKETGISNHKNILAIKNGEMSNSNDNKKFLASMASFVSDDCKALLKDATSIKLGFADESLGEDPDWVTRDTHITSVSFNKQTAPKYNITIKFD